MIKSVSIFCVLFCMTLSQLFCQLVVTKIDQSKIDPREEGFIYSLPRTGISVDIQVSKTQRIKGPYSEFAEKYLGLSQVISANSTEYEIESLHISTFTEPDPSNYYFVRSQGKKKNRHAMEFYLSERGTLIGIQDLNENINKRQNKEIGRSAMDLPEVLNPGLFERVDTLIRKISIDTTTIEQKVFKKISTAKPPELKAKEAADFVLKLDESMFNLINGYQEVNYEKGTMEFMYRQMNELKNEYLELFKGVEGKTTETITFTYIPLTNSQNQLATICKFSLSKGILDKSSPFGDLIQLEVNNLDYLSSVRGMIEARNTDNKENKGLFYCIPDRARIAVKIGGQVKNESQVPINQFGIVTYLPFSSVSNLELFDTTGGLKHVIIK